MSQVVRACSCFGVNQCWFTGDRVQLELQSKTRLPREERMKGYSDVDIIHHDYPFDQFKNVIPIGIEVIDGAEILTNFQHPKNAVYVFGPEDGGLTKIHRKFCHRFVFIPMKHCSNLAAAVYITLYDRMMKEGAQIHSVNEILAESRGRSDFEDKYYGNSDGNYQDTSIKEMLK